MKTHFCALLAVLLLTFSCSRDDVAPAADSSPEFAADASNNACQAARQNFTTNKHVIKENLELIRLGLLGLMNNPQFTSMVVQKAGLKQVDGDFGVTLKTCAEAVATTNGKLTELMVASLLQHGGTQSDGLRLLNVLEQFTISGQTYSPIIFFPYADGSYFNHAGWDGKTPSLITTLLSNSGNDFEGLTINGTSTTITEGVFDTAPVWIVSFARTCDEGDGNHLPLAPRAQCYKVQRVNQPGVFDCQLTISNTTCGKADRNGRCNNNAH
jgi:hypothetical protein